MWYLFGLVTVKVMLCGISRQSTLFTVYSQGELVVLAGETQFMALIVFTILNNSVQIPRSHRRLRKVSLFIQFKIRST